MKYARICLVFAFVISSFVVAGQPGQEDTPSCVPLLYANQIWSHKEIGWDCINEKIEQLTFAQQALQYFQEESKCGKMVLFYKEVVRIKQAQLDYLCEGHGMLQPVLSEQKAEIIFPMTSKKARRKQNTQMIFRAKKKQ